MSRDSTSLLRVSNLSKRYGDNTVLNRCSLDVRHGEIHALLGGNGAGKSTLVRSIAGLVRVTDGELQLEGSPYLPRSKRDAESAGVEIVQQEFNLIPTLSVAENLFLSRLPQRLGTIHWSELERRASVALARVGLGKIDPKRLVSSLGVGQQQLVEIAGALDRRCKLLILDEPTAALSQSESEILFDWLNKLRVQGVGIIYISHRLDEVVRLSDRITVLRDGHSIQTVTTSATDIDELLKLMTGDTLLAHQESHAASATSAHAVSATPASLATPAPLTATAPLTETAVAMRVDSVSGGRVKPCTFEVRAGERLGITGLVGSGRTELLRLIFGADRARTGNIGLLDAAGKIKEFSTFHSPREAVQAGLAMITEDRKANGLLLPLGLRENATLVALRSRFHWLGWVLAGKESQFAKRVRDELAIRSTSIEQTVGTLSGGNQQKVAISKWLAGDASVYLFDEPTRGIDVPARKRIYKLISSLADQGKGIIIVSSDNEELLENCDRILVMSNGELVDDIPKNDFNHDRIMRSSFQGYRDGSGTK